MNDAPEKEVPSILILIGAIVLAVSIWFLWLYFGAALVHSRVTGYAAEYARQAASSTTPAASAVAGVAGPLERGAVMAEVGQSGDAFGAANALFAAIAGALVLWAGVLQGRALRQARQATKEAAQAYTEERAANKREHFTSTFFQMLTLSRQLVERIDIRTNSLPDKEPREGAAALESLAASLVKTLAAFPMDDEPTHHQASKIATAFIGNVYNRYPSALGPYFRLLFQTFHFVAKADITEEERIRFANIARGQISEGAVMLLAANGLTEQGHRFIPLIEQFGLLEHLHRDYRIKFKRALLSGYRPRAFMGSEERKNQPLEATPLHGASYFVSWPDAMGDEPLPDAP